MQWLDTLRHRLAALFGRRRLERDLDDELAFHLEMEIAQRVARGEDPEEARRRALVTFGGVERAKEECRDVRPWHWAETLLADLRYSVRTLLRSPGYTAAAVLTLALGIGANAAVFSVVYGVLLKPLPYDDGERLVRVRQQAPGYGADDLGFSVAEIEDFGHRTHTLESLVEYHDMTFTLLGRGEPLRVRTGVVSADFFAVLGVQPRLGRTFLASDDEPGAEAVLVLSHGFWQTRLGGDPGVVGRVFEMNDRAHVVVGVLPPVPQYPDDNDLYMPTSACPFRSNPDFIANRQARMMSAIARLRPGVTLAAVRADLSAVAAALAGDHPEVYPEAAAYAAGAETVAEELTRSARPTLLVLLGTVCLVLLIACANVSSLALARLLRRDQELAVRAALGAGRGRLLRQQLTESALLALAGGVLGLGLAAAGLELLTAFAARFSPRAGEVGIDGVVLLFTLGASLAAGFVCGALPALARRGRVGGLTGTRVAGSRTGARLRGALVVAQIAVSVVLLAAAGLMLRSLLELQQVDPGFEGDRVLTATLDLNWSRYGDREQQLGFFLPLLERLRGPGIEVTAYASTYPLDGFGPWQRQVRSEGRTPEPDEMVPPAGVVRVSEGFFRALRVPFAAGRGFTSADDAGAPPVAVVNRRLARRLWGERDPVGRRLSVDDGESWATVVGVAGDVRHSALDREADAVVYLPFRQFPTRVMRVLLRGSDDPAQLARRLRAAVYALDGEQPVAEVRTVGEARAAQLAPPRLTAALLGLFAVLALAISATGLAGLVAYSVSQRTQEIGVRMALGAPRGRVLALVLGRGMAPVAIGLALGLAAAFPATRALSGLLYGVGPDDPSAYIAAAAVLGLAAALACLAPARRATAIDPMTTLRCE